MRKGIFLLLLLPTLCFAQDKTANYNEVVNKTVKGKITSYITRKGEKFNVGDTITLGVAFRNETFNYIIQNAVIATYPLQNNASGSLVVIKTLKAYSKEVLATTTHPNGYVYGLWVMNLEAALENGEIKSKIMSSDEALTELKKCKDKLDLGLITQETFDLKKKELSKYIK